MVTLILTDHGSKIQKSKELFKISFGMSSKPMAYSPAKLVENIIIDANVSITSGAFNLIRMYGISIYWHDYKDMGMMLLPQFNNGMVSTRKEQYMAITDLRGFHISRAIIIQSINNRLILLKSLARRKNKLKKSIIKAEKKSKNIIDKINKIQIQPVSKCREKLMSFEAQISKEYFNVIRELLSEYNWKFERRSRRPANDEFNAMLNYGYAILKSQITQFIVISGLDIFAGILHVDRSGRESLVLDMIEEFRQVIVDETIIDLIITGKISTDLFEANEDEIELSQEVKNIYLSALFKKIDSKSGKTTYKRHFLIQSRKLVKYITGSTPSYKPFKNKVKKN